MKNQTKLALVGVFATALLASQSFALVTTKQVATSPSVTPVVKVKAKTDIKKVVSKIAKKANVKKVTTAKKANVKKVTTAKSTTTKKDTSAQTKKMLENKIAAIDKEIITAQDQKVAYEANTKLSASVKASKEKIIDTRIAKFNKTKSDLETKLANVATPTTPVVK